MSQVINVLTRVNAILFAGLVVAFGSAEYLTGSWGLLIIPFALYLFVCPVVSLVALALSLFAYVKTNATLATVLLNALILALSSLFFVAIYFGAQSV